jgi:multidrug efflux system membrane fusion protein
VYRSLIVVATFACLVALFAGCNTGGPQIAPPETPVIPVAHPEPRVVTDFVDYTGRTNAVNANVIQPRVTGYLKATPFKEGGEVKEGDILFEIDPAPYQAQLEAAQAQVALNEASVKYAKATNERFKALAKKSPGAVSERELDQYQALEEQALANLKLAKANLDSAELNLKWTKVRSPIDGRVSRYFLTVGNLVNQDQTQLTTVVSLDPMYVYFDMDESTYLQMKRAINDGRITVKKGHVYVMMGLEGDDGYPHEGPVNFLDNAVNPATASIPVRAEFSNPRPISGSMPVPEWSALAVGLAGLPMAPGPLLAASAPVLPEKIGTQLMVPGNFARVRFPMGQPRPALLVNDKFITADLGYKYVYVVDKNNNVKSQRITAGALQPDGMRVIESGLQPDDWVVIGSLQQVRPNMKIQPEKMKNMPSLGVPVEREIVPPVIKGAEKSKR